MSIVEKMKKDPSSPAMMEKETTWEDVLELFDLTVKALHMRDAKIKSLTERVAAIEARGVVYRGAWQAADEYNRGDLVTFDGSLFHANDRTRARPGDGKSWQLACKRGKDGKDAPR